MTTPPLESPAPAARASDPGNVLVPPGLGARTTSGFAWLSVQMVLAKIVGFGGQLVLAMFLLEEDFGLVALAYAVAAFANLVQHLGFSDILIRRQQRFAKWATPAFWLLLVLGAAGAAALAGLAWPMASWFGEPNLAGLLLLLAVELPLRAVAVVPETRLRIQLRFRFLAMLGNVQVVAQQGLAVLLAVLGCGAYSFVVPRVAVAGLAAAVVWLAAWPPVRGRPEVGRWHLLMGDSVTLLLANLCLVVTFQADYLILGWLHPPEVVGVYFFAFNLSMQAMILFASNLSSVLFPSLSRIQHDPARQTQAFLRAAGLLAVVGVPACLLQAALVEPGLRALYPDGRWDAAIPVLQVLSVGMALRVVGSPAGSLLHAQGRFRTVLVLNLIYAVVFLSFVTAGALLGGAVAVAIGAAAYFLVLGPVHMYVAIRPGGGTWRAVGRVYGWPVALSVAASGAAAAAAWFVPEMPLRNGVRIGVTLAVAAVIYIPLLRLLAPATWGELLTRVTQLRGGGSGLEQM